MGTHGDAALAELHWHCPCYTAFLPSLSDFAVFHPLKCSGFYGDHVPRMGGAEATAAWRMQRGRSAPAWSPAPHRHCLGCTAAPRHPLVWALPRVRPPACRSPCLQEPLHCRSTPNCKSSPAEGSPLLGAPSPALHAAGAKPPPAEPPR